MSKHKQGPWTIDTKPLGNMAPLMVAEIESEDSIVCSIWDNNETEMSKANARLIAAAPDMYDFLKEVARHSISGMEAMWQAKKLLTRINPTT